MASPIAALPVQSFPILTPEQMSGHGNLLKNALERFRDITNTSYLPDEKKQALALALANAQKAQAEAKYAPQMQEAKLNTERSYPGLYGAQANHFNAESNKMNTMTPLEAEKIRIANQYAPQMNDALINQANANAGRNTPEAKQKDYENKLEEKGWNDTLSKASEESTQAAGMNEHISAMDHLYKNEIPFSEKGALGAAKFGILPEWTQSRATDEFKKHATAVYSQAASSLQKGHITNGNFQMFSKMKLTPDMSEKGFDRFKEFTKGVGQRTSQHADFLDHAKDLGMPLHKAKLAWSKYINDNNFFDQEKGKVKPENLDSSKFYKYLGDEHLKNQMANKDKVLKYNVNTGDFE